MTAAYNSAIINGQKQALLALAKIVESLEDRIEALENKRKEINSVEVESISSELIRDITGLVCHGEAFPSAYYFVRQQNEFRDNVSVWTKVDEFFGHVGRK